MILSDITLKELLANKEIEVTPLSAHAIQPGSIDCRLGDHFLRSAPATEISLDKPPVYEEIVAEKVIIPPHSFLLATTMETIRLPGYLSAFVEGRSSIGRIGLFIQNAGWVDAGFEGKITLELYNANAVPIVLSAGRRICQLVFCRMDRAAAIPYQGKYQGQSRSEGSRIYLDPEGVS